MNFQFKHPKFKPKLLIMVLIAIFSMTVAICNITTTNVYASEAGNGDDDDGGEGTRIVSGGPKSTRCAYLLYIVDKDGNLLTDVVETTIAGCEAPPSDAIYDYEYSRFGGVAPSIFDGGADWGSPFDSNGNGRGSEIKEIMLSKNSEGDSFVYTVVEKYLGTEVAREFKGSDQYFIIEGVYWAKFQNGTEKGYWNVATAKGWAQAQNDCGCGELGYNLTSRYTNNIYPNCMKFEFTQFGLSPTPSGKQTNDTIINTAGGVISIWGKEGSGQTTCDETQGDIPHIAPPESDGQYAIVKNYRTEIAPGEYTDDGCFIKNNISRNITIEDEVSYRVVGWKISDSTLTIDSKTWPVPGTIAEIGNSAGVTVEIKKPSTVLYVLLEKQVIEEPEVAEADYTVKESQVTRAISLKTDDEGDNILKDKKFKWNFGSLATCPGHNHDPGCENADCTCDLTNGQTCSTDHGKRCPGHECSSFTLSDTGWTFKLKNNKKTDYPKNLAVNDYWPDYNSEETATRSSTDAGNTEKEFDYKVVLHRGSDTLSIAEWKNINEALNSLDNFNTVNKKSPNRRKVDYTESVSFEFADDSTDKTTAATGSTGLDDLTGCSLSDDASLETSFSTDVTILYETYSGLLEGGTVNSEVDTREMITLGSVGKQVASGKMVKSGLSFSFHPWVQMRYDSMSSDGAVTKDNLIKILGEYRRGLDLNDYAEIIWTNTPKSDNNGNLNIESAMWSTHAQAIKNHLNGTVAIGGMTWELNTKQTEEFVKLKTYQSIVMKNSEARTQIRKTSGALTGYDEDTALDNHKAYVESVVNGFEALGVSQWVNKDETKNPFDGIKVNEGSNISSLGNTADGKASTDDKYYFRQDSTTNSGANENDLDVLYYNGVQTVGSIEDATTTTYYVFKTDNAGNIYMNNQVILTKTQDESSLTGKAKELDEKTYIVRKIVDALERNSGNDAENTWTDSAWYNEILDSGVAIAESTTTIKVGMFKPSERISVLDVKLTPKSENKADIFTQFFSTAFRTNDYSDNYGKKYVIGKFKGSNVLMNKMEQFFVSRKVYIANYNVQNNH